MKKSIFLTLLTCIVLSGTAQITITRQTSFGGSNRDECQKAMKVGSSYYFAGTSNSGVSFDKTEPSRGMTDFWLLKTDTLFNILWQRTIGGNHIDDLTDMIHTSDSGILLLGYSASDSSGEKSSNGYGDGDYWLVKLSDDGKILWDRTIGGTGADDGGVVIELNDGTLLLGGTSRSDSSGLRTQFLRGGSDFWLVKIDQQGGVIWDRAYGGNGFERMMGMTLLNDTLVVMSGRTNSTASYEKSSNGYGPSDIWVVCADVNGNLIWEKTLGGSKQEIMAEPVVLENHLYIIADSDSDISGTKTENSKGGRDYWIVKLDPLGNIIWDKTIGGTEQDYPTTGIISSSGHLIITGMSMSGISGDKTESNRGWGDYWLVAIDTSGNVLWDKTFGGSSSETGYDIIETRPGRYVVAGTSESGFSGDKTSSLKGEKDFWIIEFDVATGITEHNRLKSVLEIYPNPASSMVWFEIETSSEKINTIELYDIHGRQVAVSHPQSHTATMDVAHLPSGIYLAKVTTSDGLLTRKVVKR